MQVGLSVTVVAACGHGQLKLHSFWQHACRILDLLTLLTNCDLFMYVADEGLASQESTADSVASSQQTSREGSPTLESLEEAKRNIQLKLQQSSAEESDSLEPLVLDSCGKEIHSQDSEVEGFIPPLPPTPVRPPAPLDKPPATPPVPSATSAQSSYIPHIQSPLTTGSSLIAGSESLVASEMPSSGSPLPQDTPESLPSIPGTPQGASIAQLVKTPSTGGSVSMVLGTPVSQGSLTKDKGLPDANKFASNIEEDIPFENLPNATGTYQKMKKVLDFIRSKKMTS